MKVIQFFLIKTVVNDSEDFETVHGYDKIVEKMANGGISMKIRMAEYRDLAAIYAIYCPYIEQTATSTEKMKLRSKNRRYQNNLKKLLSYALES